VAASLQVIVSLRGLGNVSGASSADRFLRTPCPVCECGGAVAARPDISSEQEANSLPPPEMNGNVGRPFRNLVSCRNPAG